MEDAPVMIKDEVMDSTPQLSSTSTAADAAAAVDDKTASSSSSTGGYTDYILRSSATAASGWKYNIMKFATLADRVIDLNDSASFQRPIRLNRKDPRTVRRLNDEDIERFSKLDVPEPDVDQKGNPFLAADGAAPGVGPDGKPLKEEMDLSLVGRGVKGHAPLKKKKGMPFKQQRTKRVYVASEEARRLKREEWMPWVLEDSEANERWIGRLEGGTGQAGPASAANQRASQAANASGTGNAGWRPTGATSEAGGGGSSYVAFVFGENGDDFKVIPASRWYKFNQGPRYAMLGVDEAESEYNKLQKSHEPERWLMHQRVGAPTSNAQASSSSSSASASASTSRIKSESSSSSSALSSSKGYGASISKKVTTGATSNSIRSRLLNKSGSAAAARSSFQLPGRKFKTVVGSSENAQGDDEYDYEADFQDDEEGIAVIDDLVGEDEKKEIDTRMKNELKAAKGFEPAEDEEEDVKPGSKPSTVYGDEIKRLVRKVDKAGVYDSEEEEENPYISDFDAIDSDSSHDLESQAAEILASKLAAPIASTSSSRRPSDHRSSSSQQQQHRSSHRPGSTSNSTSHSRNLSRSGSAGPSSGSAHIAKRATSPHPSTNRSPSSSRASSPASSSRAESPSGVDANGSKRKRTEGEGGASDDKRHKAGSQSPPPSTPIPLLTEHDLAAFLKTGPALTTMNLLLHFKKSLKDPRNKAAIKGLITSVATLDGGNLILNDEWK